MLRIFKQSRVSSIFAAESLVILPEEAAEEAENPVKNVSCNFAAKTLNYWLIQRGEIHEKNNRQG